MRQLYYPRSFYYVTRHGPIELSPKVADALGLPRSTLYRWQRRLKAEGLRGLEERSRRPRRVRQKQWEAELAGRVGQLRESCHGWGRDKLAPLLWEEGERVSISTVGRILKHLKARGQLVEPHRQPVRLRYRRHKRPYAYSGDVEHLIRSMPCSRSGRRRALNPVHAVLVSCR